VNKQALVRTFACAPLFVLGITAAISSQGKAPEEIYHAKYAQDSAAMQAISQYADKASTTVDKKLAARYFVFATNLIECISTQEGRELATEYIESARRGTKIAQPDQEDEFPTLS
jgi:hypothetical protein